MKIIIPMAGTGNRFVEAGYRDAKPLIKVNGRMIIEYILDMFCEEDIVFVCNDQHLNDTNISKVLKKVGLDKHSRMSVTTGLYEASLRGVDSHGVRLLNHYVLSAAKGRKNPKPNYKFYKSFPALGVLNADNAFSVHIILSFFCFPTNKSSS